MVQQREAMEARPIALAIMCKAPIPGASKTRLCPPLTAAEAAGLSAAFITDTAAAIADVAASSEVRGVAVFSPAEKEAQIADLLPDGFARIRQHGDGLGDRVLNAASDLLALGFAALCLINADSPTLPAKLLMQATEDLSLPGDRLVLGPALDGGYYLIGLKRAHAELFGGIPWSTDRVLDATLARARNLSFPVSLLPAWYDVDDGVGLRLLMDELFGAAAPWPLSLAGGPARKSRAFLNDLLQGKAGSRFGLRGAEP